MIGRFRRKTTLSVDGFLRNLVSGGPGSVRLLPCSPWDRWVLVALHRHSARQRFVERVVSERLSGSPGAISKGGAFEHPGALPGAGPVPGLAEWHYRFHGRGCCLSHEDGTRLDVDFDEHGSRSVDPYFYGRYLETCPNLGWVEQHLADDDGGFEGWRASIPPLAEAGLLEGDHRRRVTQSAKPWCEAVSAALDEADSDPSALLRVALAIEDYETARQLGGDVPLDVAERQVEARCTALEQRIEKRSDSFSGACVSALHSLDPNRTRRLAVEDVRRGPVDGVLSRTMGLLAADPRPEDREVVEGLLRRLRGNRPPAPYLRKLATRHLLASHRRGTLPEQSARTILQHLATDQRSGEGAAAFLIYLLNAERGLRRMTAGLYSAVPIARAECAAGLALIGTDDALEALRDAATAEAASVLALLRGEDPEPGPAPVGKTITWKGRPKKVYTIAELLAADFESHTFEFARSFWQEWEPISRRWEAD